MHWPKGPVLNTNLSMLANRMDIVPFNPTLIVIDPREPSVDIVLRRIEEGAINLQPDFQRMGGIWDEGAQSRLIESMLLRIPLPAFYLDASNENEWLVIDGHQRLTAIYKFMCLRELKLSNVDPN